MNLIEFYPQITEALHKLEYSSEARNSIPERPYLATNLILLREEIHSITNVPYIEDEIHDLESSWLFAKAEDSGFKTVGENNIIIGLIYRLKLKLSVLKEIIEGSSYFNKENVLYVKLPELNNFEDLSKTSNELKKAIEIPIMDEAINGDIKILAGDQGSVILYVSLGTILAMKLIAAICWASYVLKRKRAEANIFEAHAKTLDLKNEALQILIDAQRQQIKNVLQSEAEAIASKHYSHSDPETLERLKLSINSVADLVERGAKILPMNSNEEIQKLFPNSNMSLIESGIKQITEGA